MNAVGMSANSEARTGDRAPIHLAEPTDLADAASLLDVFQDRLDLGWCEPGVEEWGAFALGGSGLAAAAAKHPLDLVGAVAVADGEVSIPRLPWSGQAELRQRKRDRSSMMRPRESIPRVGQNLGHFPMIAHRLPPCNAAPPPP